MQKNSRTKKTPTSEVRRVITKAGIYQTHTVRTSKNQMVPGADKWKGHRPGAGPLEDMLQHVLVYPGPHRNKEKITGAKNQSRVARWINGDTESDTFTQSQSSPIAATIVGLLSSPHQPDTTDPYGPF